MRIRTTLRKIFLAFGGKSYENANFIREMILADFYARMMEKLAENGYTYINDDILSPDNYTTDAPEATRMTLHNEVLDDFRERYRGKFAEHPMLDRQMTRAINRSYYSEKKIKKASGV